MRLCVIADGFQEDYMLHYLVSIAGKVEQTGFIGLKVNPRDKSGKEFINFIAS